MQPKSIITESQARDPEWRIRNIYWIKDKDAKEVRFIPNAAQEQFLSRMWSRNIILKARQLGFSTLYQLMMLDQCIFNDNIQAGVIAQDQEAASNIFRNKIKFAWDRLPEWVRKGRPTVGDSAQEIRWANGSSIRVSTSMRSGTLQWLHVSEFGKICAKYPEKAREVLTGSLPTVPSNGFICIESTAEGREGAFYDMCEEAKHIRDEGRPLTPLDFRFHFFAWHDSPEYSLDLQVEITDKDLEYFGILEAKLDKRLTAGQRAWYITTRRTSFANDPFLMKQEYPSFPEEAFEQSIEGVYYAAQMAQARKDGRIGNVPHLPGYPVNTFWDIGAHDGTAIWFHQHVRGENRFIRFYESWGEPYSHFVAEMQRHGYVWGKHYLPHDAKHRRQGRDSNKTPEEMLRELGLANISVESSAISRVIVGIQQTRDLFPTIWMDATHCDQGIRHLDLYRKDWNENRGCWSDDPRHDENSEAADAIRQFGQRFQVYAESQSSHISQHTAALTANPF